jgi:hypothetical protein
MPITPLNQILGVRNLSAVLEQVDGGVPNDLLPPALTEPSRTVEGDTGVFLRYEATRQTAQRRPYGSPATQADPQGLAEVLYRLIHTNASIQHEAATLINLRGLNGVDAQRMGEQEIARQTAELKRRFANLRLAAVYSMLANGAIYFDAQGNLLHSDTAATFTIDFGIPAEQTNQIALGPAGANLISDWSTATTNIIAEFRAVRSAFRKRCGLRIANAVHTSKLVEYFLANNTLKLLLEHRPSVQAGLEAGMIPDGFLGVDKWWSVDEAFSQDADGVDRDFFSANALTLFPAVDPVWYEFVEGTYPVPSGPRQESPAEMADPAQGFVKTPGMYSYATVQMNPPGILQIAGDTFLPMLRNPRAMMLAVVA